jgi:hypothetical protein
MRRTTVGWALDGAHHHCRDVQASFAIERQRRERHGTIGSFCLKV